MSDVLRELRSDGVGVITLNRPESLNSFTIATFEEFGQAIRELGAESGCGAVVVSGAGRAFSSGMHLRGVHDDPNVLRGNYAVLRAGVGAMTALREIRQPVIAAVRGYAVGAGFALAANADIRICAPDTRFRAVFVDVGMSAGDLGLSWLLPRLIGAGHSAELFYTGGELDAEAAERLGFVQHVVDDPVDAASALAATIAAKPTMPIQFTKELLNASIAAGGLREHLELELRSQVLGLLSQDHANAVASFATRRPIDHALAGGHPCI